MEHDTRARFNSLDRERNIATERHSFITSDRGHKTLKMINSSRLILELTWSKLALRMWGCGGGGGRKGIIINLTCNDITSMPVPGLIISIVSIEEYL